MRAHYACQSMDHLVARRRFLGTLAGGAVAGGAMTSALGALASGACAKELSAKDMRVVVFNLHGGLSQLESWDPKPGAATGGPFRAIPTSVPGLHISELLPHSAKIMHHLCVMRGVNTSEDDHGKGAYMMMTGRRQTPAGDYPQLGAVASRMLTEESQPLPGHVLITPGGGGGRSADAAYLGPKYSSVVLGGGAPPNYSVRPDGIPADMEQRRHDLRRQINEQFLSKRRTAVTEAYTHSYEQALRLMEKREVFDVAKESEQDQTRYGKHDFGRHCLLARRLLEAGVSYIQVVHSNYDTHNENFDFHLEQMGEFDQPFACFVQDLFDRGLLDQTLVVVLSEFGRTPNINLYYGRDHWSKAWSVVMGGAKVHRGAVYGKTNDQGTEVVDGQVNHGELFHTYLQAVGVDSNESLVVDGRKMPLADPSEQPIWSVLS
ncbi:MAG: DUF1501 domain-containing protein [Pirellulales bacterium]